jgi:hypothetical protein
MFAVGGADFVITRSAAGADTVVVARALLLDASGSAVALETVAVLLTAPATAGPATVSVNVPPAPLASVGMVAVTVPVPPTAGVVRVHPAGAVIEVKVVPGGSTSLMETLAAGCGPLFVTVMV